MFHARTALALAATSLLLTPVLVEAQISASERQALIDFYQSLNGPGWATDGGLEWLGPEGSECDWFGVVCDESNSTVTQLSLPCRGLKGSIPASIGHLSNLKYLDARNEFWLCYGYRYERDNPYNSISGPLPREIGSLKKLRSINLEGVGLGGSLPPEFGNLGSLEEALLGGNGFEGSLPAEIGQLNRLTVLELYGSRLSGTIPPEIGFLSALEHLNLAGNDFSGTLPQQIGDLTSLQNLNLDDNQLTGSIPGPIGQLDRLKSLSIARNRLTGPLPPEIGGLASVQNLELNENQLTGSIPRSIGQLGFLEELNLQDNLLSGPIPGSIGRLGRLEGLYLDRNRLTGPVPGEIGNLESLRFLSVASNHLDGALPETIGNLQTVHLVDLHDNRLSGSIPSEIGGARVLRYLNLSRNRFEGPIPRGMEDLSGLDKLLLSDNPTLRAATIPSFLARMNALRHLDLSNTNRIGPLPDWLGETELTHLNLDDNHFTGPIPEGLLRQPALVELSLRRNELNGIIPNPGRRGKIWHLHLEGNRFEPQPFPDWLRYVIVMNLSLSGLNGVLPLWLGDMTDLYRLEISDSELVGGIPESFGRLKRLRSVRFADCGLEGEIPAQIMDLRLLNDADHIDEDTGEPRPGLDFCGNSLWTDEPGVLSFVNEHHLGGDFAACQRSSEAPPREIVAAFLPSTERAVPRETIRFHDRSQGVGLSYDWDFGDGSSSSASDPVYAYAEAGRFHVTLTISDLLGRSAVAQRWIDVGQPNLSASGVVLEPDGTPVDFNGMVTLIPWGDAKHSPVRESHAAEFAAGDGSWQVEGLAPGVYLARIDPIFGINPIPPPCVSESGTAIAQFFFLITVEPHRANHFEYSLLCDGAQLPSELRESFSCIFETNLLSVESIPLMSGMDEMVFDASRAMEAESQGLECKADALRVSLFWDYVDTLSRLGEPVDIERARGQLAACGWDVPVSSCDELFGVPGNLNGSAVQSGSLAGPALARPLTIARVLTPSDDMELEMETATQTGLALRSSQSGIGSMVALSDAVGIEQFVLTNRSGGSQDAKLLVTHFAGGVVVGRAFPLTLDAGQVIRGSVDQILEDESLTSAWVQGGEIAASRASTRPTPWVTLPAAAHLEGANDSEWRSNLVISNPLDRSLMYRIDYFVAGFDGSASTRYGAIPPKGSVLAEDIVQETFGHRGNKGWIRILGSHETHAVLRTYNRSETGTEGQSFSGLPSDYSLSPKFELTAVEESDEFRSNVGLINTSHLPNLAELWVVGDDGEMHGPVLLELGPYEQRQVDRIVRVAGLSAADGAVVEVAFRAAGGVVYGSKVDNSSNDPLTLIPNLAKKFFVPVVIEKPGLNGAHWHTDLRLFPVTPAGSTEVAMYLGLPFKRSTRMTLPAGHGGHTIENVFELFSASEGQAFLYIEASQPLSVSCRVYSDADSGSRGQGMPIVPELDSARTLGAGDRGWLIALQESAGFRSNLAIQNYSFEHSSYGYPVYADASVRLQTFAEDGSQIGNAIELSLPAASSLNLTRFLATTLGESVVDLAQVEVTCLKGNAVGAYSSLVDNRTNDGTFMPMFVIED